MEQSNTYNAINFNISMIMADNNTAQYTRISSFLCPSDTTPDKVPVRDRTNTNTIYTVGTSNYIGVYGVGEIGDAAGQTEQAMANIKMLLEEAGSKLEHICKITIYLVDPRYREPVYRTIGKWLKGVYPVSTGIVVSALARPEWLVEIDATAVIPDAG